MYCTNCGKENIDTAKFCMYCGAAMEIPQRSPVSPQEPTPTLPAWQIASSSAAGQYTERRGLPTGLKRVLSVVGIVAVVLLVLAGGAMAAGRYWLRLGANETAKMMPAETAMYAVFNPGVRQLAHVADLLESGENRRCRQQEADQIE